MKKIDYSISPEDAKTILFTLTILPELNLEDSYIQANINAQLAMSVAEKLVNQENTFTKNEFRVIYASLLAAQQINQGILEVNNKIRKDCSQYMFAINKLVSVFSGII